MSILTFSGVVSDILTCDVSLFEMILRVSVAAKRAKLEWVTSDVADVVDEEVKDDVYKFLVDSLGNVTVIPCYDSYVLTWRGSLQRVCPLDVLWLDYDLNSAQMNRYISGVLPVLVEQVIWWSVDETTRVCPAFTHFKDFVEALELLYERVTNVWVVRAETISILNEMVTS